MTNAIVHSLIKHLLIVNIIGETIIISMSKLKKITAIKKKWSENGNYFNVIGLNQHSNKQNFWPDHRQSTLLFYHFKHDGKQQHNRF